MCFHGNQHLWATKHPFISLYSKYQSFTFIHFSVMNSPVFPNLDDIYCSGFETGQVLDFSSFWSTATIFMQCSGSSAFRTRPDTRPICSRWRVGRSCLLIGRGSHLVGRGCILDWAGAAMLRNYKVGQFRVIQNFMWRTYVGRDTPSYSRLVSD